MIKSWRRSKTKKTKPKNYIKNIATININKIKHPLTECRFFKEVGSMRGVIHLFKIIDWKINLRINKHQCLIKLWTHNSSHPIMKNNILKNIWIAMLILSLLMIIMILYWEDMEVVLLLVIKKKNYIKKHWGHIFLCMQL